MLIFWTTIISIISCFTENKQREILPIPRFQEQHYDWAAIADSVQLVTFNTFMADNGQYFAQDNSGNQTFHYWWNAHVLDVMVDLSLRKRSEKQTEKMLTLLRGIKTMNGGTYLIGYYDDMEWLALSSLRAYEATGEKEFLEVSEILWEDIKTGWNEQQAGGIAWRKTQLDYKNTPANAPAVILAARLYKKMRRPDDLAWAKRIYKWQKANLVDPHSGLVWDGKNRKGDNAIDKNWRFTYNQGVYIGAAVELYLLTGDEGYLDDAIKTADNVVSDPHLAPGGLLKNEGSGDGGLFKGILVRYLTYMIKKVDLPKDRKNVYLAFLQSNAESLYENIRRPEMLIGPSWDKPAEAEMDASVQLSGLTMLEAMVMLDSELK